MSPRDRHRPPASGGILSPSPEPLMSAPPPETRPEDTDPLVYMSGRVPKSLRDAAQHQAIREGRPLAKLMADAMEAYLRTRSDT